MDKKTYEMTEEQFYFVLEAIAANTGILIRSLYAQHLSQNDLDEDEDENDFDFEIVAKKAHQKAVAHRRAKKVAAKPVARRGRPPKVEAPRRGRPPKAK